LRQIPGLKKKPWYTRNIPEAILTAFVPALTSGVGSVTLFNATWNDHAFLGACLAVGALLAAAGGVQKLRRAVDQDKQQAQANTPDGILAAVHVVYHVLAHWCQDKGTDPGNLRINFHSVIKQPKQGIYLEQIIPYVGGNGGPPGRRTDIKTGIVGRVARTHNLCALHRDGEMKHDALIELLTGDWGFTEDEARSVAKDRYSWLGIPICDNTNHQVVGVLFLDSTNPELCENSSFQSQTVSAAAGIIEYVSERYG